MNDRHLLENHVCREEECRIGGAVRTFEAWRDIVHYHPAMNVSGTSDQGWVQQGADCCQLLMILTIGVDQLDVLVEVDERKVRPFCHPF